MSEPDANQVHLSSVGQIVLVKQLAELVADCGRMAAVHIREALGVEDEDVEAAEVALLQAFGMPAQLRGAQAIYDGRRWHVRCRAHGRLDFETDDQMQASVVAASHAECAAPTTRPDRAADTEGQDR